MKTNCYKCGKELENPLGLYMGEISKGLQTRIYSLCEKCKKETVKHFKEYMEQEAEND